MKKICEKCGKKRNEDMFSFDSDICIDCEQEIEDEEGLSGMDDEEREGMENLIEYFNKD